MTRAKREPTVFKPADQFIDAKCGWVYHFPISQGLHPKYGRMEVEVEMVQKHGKISALRLQFRQHEIAELAEPFEIPTPQADKFTGLTTWDRITGTSSFFTGTWRIAPCTEHRGNWIISSYVPEGVTGLRLQLLTASINVHYTIAETKVLHARPAK